MFEILEFDDDNKLMQSLVNFDNLLEIVNLSELKSPQIMNGIIIIMFCFCLSFRKREKNLLKNSFNCFNTFIECNFSIQTNRWNIKINNNNFKFTRTD